MAMTCSVDREADNDGDDDDEDEYAATADGWRWTYTIGSELVGAHPTRLENNQSARSIQNSQD